MMPYRSVSVMIPSSQSPSLPFLVGDEPPDRHVAFWRRPFAHHPSDVAEITEPYDSPFNIVGGVRELTVSLLRSFRFIHEPIGNESPVPFVGRQSEIESLAERILFAEGGSFLVTGCVGVGKTSFVAQVIHKLETVLPWARPLLGEVEIVDVHLHVPRPIKPDEIMRHIMRQLYERLMERRIIHQLDPSLRRALRFACDRPSDERDIINLSRRLAAGFTTPASRWQRLRRRLAAEARTRVRLKIVFVVDDLDELEKTTTRPLLERTFAALKNLFSTSPLTFVFMASEELRQRASRGATLSTLYESVVTHHTYLPRLWTGAGPICDALIDPAAGLTPPAAQIFDAFKKYLAYRGRGIPRRILRLFNEYTGWDDDRPQLRFTARDVRWIRFVAGLENMLETHEPLWFSASCEDDDCMQGDERRLALYRIVDRSVRRGAREFTLADILAASKRASGSVGADAITARLAASIIELLIAREYIEAVPRNLANVVIGVPSAEPPARYRVARRRLAEMGMRAADGEARGLLGDGVEEVPPERDHMPASIGAFRVVREIGRGGMGIVYEAIGDESGQRVAIKVMTGASGANTNLAAYFEREAHTLAALDHPSIVRLVDSGRDDARLYLAMEFIDGVMLEEVIRHRGRLGLDAAVAIVAPVLEAVQYVHQQGFVRNDIKTTNIMLTRAGRVCLVDFGVSRPKATNDDAGPTTRSCGIVGTPLFMAPEQLCDHRADERSDVYAVGVVIYRMLTGTYPVAEADLSETMRPHVSHVPEPLSRRAVVSAQVEKLVMRCLAKDPADRYQSMSEVAKALHAVAQMSTPIDLVALVHEVRESTDARRALDEIPTLACRAPARATATPNGEPLVPLASAVSTAASVPRAAPWRGVGAFTPGAPTADPSGDAVAYAMPDLAGFARPYLALIRGSQERVVTPDGAPVAALHLERRLTLGRGSGSDVILRDANVSRYHAILSIAQHGDDWFIEDANSEQGTCVRGERVIEPRQLQDGDEIQIGAFMFVFGSTTPSNTRPVK